MELSVAACEGEKVAAAAAAASLTGNSGAHLAKLPLILSEAASLNLAVVGLALNLRLSEVDHEENLARLRAGLEVVAVALRVARENEVEVETVHLGEICSSASSLRWSARSMRSASASE